MKQILLLLIIPFLSFGQQQTYVPDDNFEQRLIDSGYDDVLDDYVLTSTINSIEQIQMSGEGSVCCAFTDLTGLEDFTSLVTLFLNDHPLVDSAIFPNTNTLWQVSMNRSNVSNFDWPPLVNLTRLTIENDSSGLAQIETPMESIDLSQHTDLEMLELGYNNLETINLETNLNLISARLLYNNLLELDVSQNTNLEYLDVRFNPLLECIQVWDVNYANSMPFFSKDPGAIWSLDCESAYGCSDDNACNYSPDVVFDNDSCEYAIDLFGVFYLDCDGNCINDTDGDSFCDEIDNCPYIYNISQLDSDNDGYGNSCDNIFGCDDELACNYNSQVTENDGSCWYAQEYYDCYGYCINDTDGDSFCDEIDNCVGDYNPNQSDSDNDGIGDDCEIAISEVVWNNPDWENFDWETNWYALALGSIIDWDNVPWSIINEYNIQPEDLINYINQENITAGGMPFVWDEFIEFINNTDISESLIGKNLITTIDILGRENTNKGFQLHIYDDGSVEKRYKIE